MTLKSVRKVLVETQYIIVAHYTKSDTYERVHVRYLSDDKDEFVKTLRKEMELENTKNRVASIYYNNTEKCIVIRIEVNEI